MPSIVHIESSNLSAAWAEAFLKTLAPNKHHPAFIVSITSLQDGIEEDDDLRQKLDETLFSEGKSGCRTVANTIFPLSMWNPDCSRQELFDRYENAWPRIRQCLANRRGAGENRADTYFRRLTKYDEAPLSNSTNYFNQLDFIAETWNGGNKRRSALQASIFMPPLDRSHSQQGGFPCLQQVSFMPLGSKGKNGLEVTALYPTQTLFEKAYGNYLGLCRLGRFMAHEMDLELSRVRCIALRMKLKNSSITNGKLENELRGPVKRLTSIIN